MKKRPLVFVLIIVGLLIFTLLPVKLGLFSNLIENYYRTQIGKIFFFKTSYSPMEHSWILEENGEEREFKIDAWDTDIFFSPDKQWLIYRIDDNLYKIKTDGTNLTQLTHHEIPTEYGVNDCRLRISRSSWSPDGKKIVYDIGTANPSRYLSTKVEQELCGIWVVNADGTDQEKIVSSYEKFIGFPLNSKWLSESEILVAYGNFGKNAVLDLETKKITDFKPCRECEDLSLSDDNKKLCYLRATADRSKVELVFKDLNTNEEKIFEVTAPIISPEISPNGRYCTFYTWSKEEKGKLFAIDLNSSAIRPIDRGSSLSLGYWSKDSKWVIYHKSLAPVEIGNIYAIKPDGSRSFQLTPDKAIGHFSP